MKRVLSILLVLVMCFTMTPIVSAATIETQTLVVGDTTYHITTTNHDVTVVDDKNGYEAVYAPSTGTLTLTDTTGKVSPVCINIGTLAEIQSNKGTPKMNIARAGNGSNSSKDNEYAYERSIKEYNNSYYTYWEIQIPNEIKMTWANANNTSTLDDFQDNVDELVELENSVAGVWGSTILSVIVGVVTASPLPSLGAALIAALSALVSSDDLTSLLTYGTDMKKCRNNCDQLFGEVIVYSIPA